MEKWQERKQIGTMNELISKFVSLDRQGANAGNGNNNNVSPPLVPGVEADGETADFGDATGAATCAPLVRMRPYERRNAWAFATSRAIAAALVASA